MGEQKLYFLREESAHRLLGALQEREKVFCTVQRDDAVDLELLPQSDAVATARLDCPRPSRTLRNILLPVRELVATYFGQAPPALLPEEPRLVVVGARACDVEALRILDMVMLEGEFQDPFYKARRDALVIVSVDCAKVTPHCFCNLVGGKPYCEQGSDINLTPVKDGFLVEVLSPRGADLASQAADYVDEAADFHVTARDRVRAETMEALNRQNSDYASGPLAIDRFQDVSLEEDPAWARHAVDCVECGACTNVCPTCYCFLMFDEPRGSEPGEFERVRTWDSCLYADYAKMAGVGGMKPDPRPSLAQRFKNRILHKYAYFAQTYGRFGCVGCGRCLEACMGGIDMREVVASLGGRQ